MVRRRRCLLVFASLLSALGCVPSLEDLSGSCRGTGCTDGGTGIEASVIADGSTRSCPGRAVPAAVRIETPFASYCIDTTEVDNDQYAQFLADSPPSVSDPGCGAKTSFVPLDWLQENACDPSARIGKPRRDG